MVEAFGVWGFHPWETENLSEAHQSKTRRDGAFHLSRQNVYKGGAGRLGTRRDIANAVVYMCAATWVTAECHTVDGGSSVARPFGAARL